MLSQRDYKDPCRWLGQGYNGQRFALDARRAIFDFWYTHQRQMPNGYGSIPEQIHVVFYVVNSNGMNYLRHVSGEIYNGSQLSYPDQDGYISPPYEIDQFIKDVMNQYLNQEMTT